MWQLVAPDLPPLTVDGESRACGRFDLGASANKYVSRSQFMLFVDDDKLFIEVSANAINPTLIRKTSDGTTTILTLASTSDNKRAVLDAGDEVLFGKSFSDASAIVFTVSLVPLPTGASAPAAAEAPAPAAGGGPIVSGASAAPSGTAAPSSSTAPDGEARKKRPREGDEDDDGSRFRTGNIFLNRLPGELPSSRHVGWSELLPADCQAALFTSLFPERTYSWLRSVSPHLHRALIIADRCPAPKDRTTPPTLTAPDSTAPGWLMLEGQRRSGGMVHCSLLLFRTPSFLRIACGGTNLEGQLLLDRDALFVQDLPIRDEPRVAAEDHEAFGEPLEEFLEYLTTVYDGLPSRAQQTVREYGHQMLDGVEFSAVEAALVTCTPGGPSGGNKGGWMMLRRALSLINAPRTNGRLDIATGHFGRLEADWTATMARTLRRQEKPSADGSWGDIGRMFLYHSSRATVLAPGTNSFAVMRTTAPGDRAGARTDPRLLEQFFHDALPKFERRAEDVPAHALTPILHGKVMLATAADGSAGVIFVGSQNFGESSWGKNGQQPNNCELGVVLSARTHAQVQELRARFPIQLAPDDAFATRAEQRGYVMARGPTDGDHEETGLQFRWRSRCTDLESLPAWRLFLHRWWKMCSGCRAANVPCELSVSQIEDLAWQGMPFQCAACQE